MGAGQSVRAVPRGSARPGSGGRSVHLRPMAAFRQRPYKVASNLSRPVVESVAIRAERPQAAGQIPNLPVDIGFLLVEYGAHPTPMNQDVAFEDVVVGEAGDWSSLALKPADQPVQVSAGLGDDGAPRCERRWDSAQWLEPAAVAAEHGLVGVDASTGDACKRPSTMATACRSSGPAR